MPARESDVGIAISIPIWSARPPNPAVYPNIYFQCDPERQSPAWQMRDGRQAQGTPCNKIPAGLINPIGQAMMNLYPQPNANNPASRSYNFANVAGSHAG